MKTFYPQVNTKLKYLNFLLGVLFVIQGGINLATKESIGYLIFGAFQVLLGLFYGYMTYVNFFSKSRFSPHLGLGENTISMKLDMFSRTKTIATADVKTLRIKPEQLGIQLTSGVQLHFPCNGSNRAEIVTSVMKYAEEKGLTLEEVGYK